ncbi:OmpA family protein [Belliella marina]|uniref:OmpA family protein n=1 Tax=Belliella marina TaxID=1644146 RepID=A0ABW4VUX1_9BACT
MNKLYIPICFLLMMLSYSQASGQNYILRYADKQYSLQNYHHAASEYERAFEKRERYSTAKRIAESYREIRDYPNSMEWWAKTVGFEEAERDDYLEYIRAAYLNLGSKTDIKELLSESRFSESDFPEIDFAYMASLYKSRSELELKPVDGVNSSDSDFGSAFDKDGNLYFASDRGEVIPSSKAAIRPDLNNIYSKERYDFNDRSFFKLYRKDSSGNLTALDSGNPEVLHFSDASFLDSQRLMFYTVTRSIRKAKRNRNFAVGGEIFYSKVDSLGNLHDHVPLGINDAVNYGVMHPFVDESASRLYFSSDMPGGYGGFDLYYMEFDSEMNFGTPVNLGAEINTDKNESHPFVAEDWFYFSSNGHPGIGGLDIFRSSIKSGEVKGVENMGVPYNSNRDDFAYSISPDGNPYLSSDREGGMGLDDIYSILELQKRLLAKVVDCDGELFAESFDAVLTDLKKNEAVSIDKESSGELRADLSPESNYDIKISKQGYFSIYDNTLSTIGMEGEILERTYRLAEIPYQMPVYVDIVYYDLDKYFIRETEMPVLDKIGELMSKYDFLDLKVSSHTDSRASHTYNETLSQNRADAVSEYLKQYNVGEDRIRSVWYGEEKLTNDCGDGVPCLEWEHQLNRRSELVLEAFSDPNRQYDLPKEFLDKDICDGLGIFEELQKELNAIPIVYFDFDKSFIRPVHRKELERTAILMKRMPNLNLYISGHTDQRGSEEYNKSLSERRAAIVMNYLVNRGVEAVRMQHEWFGKTQPVNDCGECDSAQHQLNRRTELQLKK